MISVPVSIARGYSTEVVTTASAITSIVGSAHRRALDALKTPVDDWPLPTYEKKVQGFRLERSFTGFYVRAPLTLLFTLSIACGNRYVFDLLPERGSGGANSLNTSTITGGNAAGQTAGFSNVTGGSVSAVIGETGGMSVVTGGTSGCSSNASCNAPAAVCNPATGACVGCLSSASCTFAARPICDGSTLTCVQCESNADCGSNSPLCNTNTHTCVHCLDNSTCGGSDVCSAQTGQCAKTCATPADCPGDAPNCDGTAKVCLQCTSDSQCSGGSAPRCDTVTGSCVQCLSNADCAQVSDAPNCETTTHTCVECLTSTQCPTGNVCAPIRLRCQTGP